jgi:hypothetical protein
MTSPAIRSSIKAILDAEWTNCPYFDLSDFIAAETMPIGLDDSALLLQFGQSLETMEVIGAPGVDGWQETGLVYFHLLFPAGDPSAVALDWGEQLRNLFRGRRLDDVIIESMPAFTDMDGAAIRLNGRWHGWSSPAAYYRVICA